MTKRFSFGSLFTFLLILCLSQQALACKDGVCCRLPSCLEYLETLRKVARDHFIHATYNKAAQSWDSILGSPNFTFDDKREAAGVYYSAQQYEKALEQYNQLLLRNSPLSGADKRNFLLSFIQCYGQTDLDGRSQLQVSYGNKVKSFCDDLTGERTNDSNEHLLIKQALEDSTGEEYSKKPTEWRWGQGIEPNPRFVLRDLKYDPARGEYYREATRGIISLPMTEF
jgi:hypothetical protein